jgi:hypothetical protein
MEVQPHAEWCYASALARIGSTFSSWPSSERLDRTCIEAASQSCNQLDAPYVYSLHRPARTSARVGRESVSSCQPPLVPTVQATQLWTDVCDRFALACWTRRKATVGAEGSFLRFFCLQFQPFKETVVCGTAFYPIERLRCRVTLIIKLTLREASYLVYIFSQPFGFVRRLP